MPTDKNSDGLIINLLNQSQFANIVTPSDTELYLVEDDIGLTQQDVLTTIGYIPENNSNKVTTLSAQSTDLQYPTAKCVYNALQNNSTSGISHTATNTDITPENGVGSWTITHNLNTSAVIVSLYLNGVEIEKNVTVDSVNAITLTFSADSVVSAGSLKAVILAGGVANTAVNNLSTLLATIYPVGSIYIGTMSTCPLAVLGIGTWQLVGRDKVLQGAGTRGSVGSELNESLPNITGSFYPRKWSNDTEPMPSSGAFYNTEQEPDANWGASWETTSTNIASIGVNFDASRSSTTYQNNAPVQQDAYLVNIWERTA